MNFFKKNKTEEAVSKEKETKEKEEQPTASQQLPLPAPLCNELSEAGQFSYAALSAICLTELFDDTPSNMAFKRSCLQDILDHLGVSKQTNEGAKVEHSTFCLLDGYGFNKEGAAIPYIEMLKEEESLKTAGCALVPNDLLSVGIKKGCYDARLRVLIRRIAELLNVDWLDVEEYERFMVASWQRREHEISEEEEQEKKKNAKKQKIKRGILIGLATVGGGTLLGLTGGLAAPLLAAGAGAIIGGAGAAALGSTAGVAIIGSLFGVAGAGLGGFKMKKRVGGVEEFAFEPLFDKKEDEDLHSDLHITVAVTGWITSSETDFSAPWYHLNHSGEQYSLRYESKYLQEVGDGIDYLLSAAVNAAAGEALKYTVLSGIMAAVAWPAALLTASSVIDNPWGVATHRSEAAGKMLADVLLERQQGKRPVTLIGYSLGARVIFYCLKEMAKRKNCEGIVQDAILLGAPVTGSSKEWKPMSKVVSGRIVNGYCRTDWLLKFLYRTASIQFSIAGLQAVRWDDRRMINVDFTDVVTGHLDYREKLSYLLGTVGVRMRHDQNIVTEEGTEADEDEWLVVNTKLRDPSKNTSIQAAIARSKSQEFKSTLGAPGEETVLPKSGSSYSLSSSESSDNIQVWTVVKKPASCSTENNSITEGKEASTEEKETFATESNQVEDVITNNSNTEGKSSPKGSKGEEIKPASMVTEVQKANTKKKKVPTATLR